MTPERPSTPVGTQIGPYTIEAKVGEGGMGTVFRALDTKLNRRVAIKLLSDDLAGTSFIWRCMAILNLSASRLRSISRTCSFVVFTDMVA
jgi:serine/threonine protein kinase